VLAAFFWAQTGALAAVPVVASALGPDAAAAALMVFIFSFSVGWGPVPWVMVAELLPPASRALGTAMSTVLTWGGSFVITQFFLLLVQVGASSLCACLVSLGATLAHACRKVVQIYSAHLRLPAVEPQGKGLPSGAPRFVPVSLGHRVGGSGSRIRV
jgi:hypothetical protein